MIKSTKKKTGRPKGFVKDRNGDRIEGLMRLKDGRWRISGPEKRTYTERDEDLAIAYFHQWTARRAGTKIAIPRAAARSGNSESVRRAILSLKPDESAREIAQTAFDRFCREFLPAEHPVRRHGSNPHRACG